MIAAAGESEAHALRLVHFLLMALGRVADGGLKR